MKKIIAPLPSPLGGNPLCVPLGSALYIAPAYTLPLPNHPK
ncbi:hypothetical protein [Pedobacter sp. ASV28]|nr:hypothetical protein [Pedobacter sp. ASV28]